MSEQRFRPVPLPILRRRRRWRRIRPPRQVRVAKAQPSFRTDRKRTTPYMVIALLTAGAGALIMFPRPVDESECGITKPALTVAADTAGVAGVVERHVLVSNPLPWGNSGAVVTRIWGDIDVNRWSVTDRRFQECSWNPPRDSGTYVFDFPSGSGQIRHDLTAVPSQAAAQTDLAGEWLGRFEGFRSFEIGPIERIMGWIRVFPEVIILLGLAGFWLSWRLAPRKVDAFGR